MYTHNYHHNVSAQSKRHLNVECSGYASTAMIDTHGRHLIAPPSLPLCFLYTTVSSCIAEMKPTSTATQVGLYNAEGGGEVNAAAYKRD